MPAQIFYLELSDAQTGAHKFYEVTAEDTRVTIRFGRIGTAGHAETRTFLDEATAHSFADAKIREKKAKGYAPAQAGALAPHPPPLPPTPGSEAWFWRLVEKAKRGTEGDCEAQCEALQEKLAALPVVDILAFQRMLHTRMDAAYRNDLWEAAYIINGGCSDDCFDYFRGWLVLQGEKVYRAALSDPDSLAGVTSEEDYAQCEDILYVPVKAYEAKTGRDDFYTLLPSRTSAVLAGSDDWGNDAGDSDEQKGAQLYP